MCSFLLKLENKKAHFTKAIQVETVLCYRSQKGHGKVYDCHQRGLVKWASKWVCCTEVLMQNKRFLRILCGKWWGAGIRAHACRHVAFGFMGGTGAQCLTIFFNAFAGCPTASILGLRASRIFDAWEEQVKV